MDEIDKIIFDVIADIDIRAERDFNDALEEFANTCGKQFSKSKRITYIQAMVKESLYELIAEEDFENVKVFLNLILSDAITGKNYFMNGNSGDEDEE